MDSALAITDMATAIIGLLVVIVGGLWGLMKYLMNIIIKESDERRRLNEKLFAKFEEADVDRDILRNRTTRVETILEERTQKK